MNEFRPYVEFASGVLREFRKLIRTLATPGKPLESCPIVVSFFRQTLVEVNNVQVLRFVPETIVVPPSAVPADVASRTLTINKPDGNPGDPIGVPALGGTVSGLSDDYAYSVGQEVGYTLKSVDAGGLEGKFEGTFIVTDGVAPEESEGITVSFRQVVVDVPDGGTPDQ